MQYKIIVAHPGRQHSFKLASALKKEGMLLYYCTSIYDKNSSLIMKCLKKILSKDNAKRASNRKNPDLFDNEVKQFCVLGGLFEALLARIDKRHHWYRRLQRYDSDRFGIKVAKLAIKENADAVIMYDSNAVAGFEYLKRKSPKIIRILDVSIVPRPFMKQIYQEEIERSGNSDLKLDNDYLWNPILLERAQNEIDNSHYFLSASDFVKNGLINCGVNDSQVFIVPYGANVSNENKKTSKRKNSKCQYLFVGQVVYRKGISYLLEAFASLNDGSELTVVGAYNDKDWFIKKYINYENIHFTGLVTFDKMQQIYEESDVFIIPSFAEGMAQVGIEAMACGLPIICTYNSGVSDLVKDGINGFVIPCGNIEALKEKIIWFNNNRNNICKMGANAREAAKNYTWENYSSTVTSTIQQAIELRK